MSLPELDLQILYGRAAWAIVLAAALIALWPRAWRLSRQRLGAIVACAAALQMLPGEGAPAYWLGLAFQWPSALLVGLSLLKLQLAWDGSNRQPVMPCMLAALIAIAGAALYLDAIGLLSLGVYYAGFGPRGAPVLSLLLAALCTAAIFAGRARAPAAALLGALLLFAVARLPTGNLWDALLDPLLWGWALFSLAATCKDEVANCLSRARAASASA